MRLYGILKDDLIWEYIIDNMTSNDLCQQIK